MAHARRNPKTHQRDQDSPTPRRTRFCIATTNTPRRRRTSSSSSSSGGPDDEGNPPPEGPGGPPPGPPPPNPPEPPPPAPPDVDDPPERPNKKKSHVKKPEDFDDAKQWDKYKRQTFVYIQENKKDFSSSESVVRFLLSFMTGGLPEKFAANFIDEVIADYEEEMKRSPNLWRRRTSSRLGNRKRILRKVRRSVWRPEQKSKRRTPTRPPPPRQQNGRRVLPRIRPTSQNGGISKNHDDVLIKYLTNR
jgi:hypothetical protein